MTHFSMDDIVISKLIDSWGFFSVLMPDYVVQYMLNDGEVPFPPGDDADYTFYVNDGVYMAQPSFFQDNGYDLVWITGTCWSSIAPAVVDLPVPVIQGEHVCLGSRENKIGSTYMFYGDRSGDTSGRNTIILTEAGKAHPICAGLPERIEVFGDGPPLPEGVSLENAWQSIHNAADDAAPGTVVLAVWDPEGPQGLEPDGSLRAAWAIVEEGGELANGQPAPARRAMIFFGGGEVRPINGAEIPAQWLIVSEYLTDLGREVLRRTVDWSMGMELAPVAKWWDLQK